MKIQNQGFDHVEYVVRDLNHHDKLWKKLGFEKIGERHVVDRGQKTVAYAQGLIRILVTGSDGSPAFEQTQEGKFLKLHGDGVCTLALDVSDAEGAFKQAVSRGARPALEPKHFESSYGSVVRAEVWTPEDLRYALITRKGPVNKMEKGVLDIDLEVSRLVSPSPMNLRTIDHLTNNVSIGQMSTWVDWYKKVFGFIVSRHFDIRTGRTGLTSDVVQSECGRIKVPINEATEKESQVQEFVERFHGVGVQHLALETTDIIDTVGRLREEGMKFLTVPHTYYEAVPARVPNVTEDLAVVEDRGVLLDGTQDGYLLQIFSEEVMGPFFFEFIQRKKDMGFGEGNFRALFEAIERDQVKRGVLK